MKGKCEMYAIICVDNKLGMSFGGRRQSMDSVLRHKVIKYVGINELWMRAYTAKQFEKDPVPTLRVDENYLQKAGRDSYCFVELDQIEDIYAKIQGILLFRWNRTYPANLFLKIPGNIRDWKIKVLEEFQGSSHERITMELWNNLKYKNQCDSNQEGE